ncbi:Flp pilus assembly complex ATPase component TadA [Pantoea ananatis]|uniref:GspE/PulE family protein n=1 Tax=Pantoea ananas TaxID=553 RepID=UPI00158E482D|nr:ATPase, T2SS/T4P/T4SS family [Pantoea ananatis]MBA4823440.1 Flp pilus assembly complex ATPase component TadA [Pantoea ananatis]QKV88052.1 Flp pilus assembly complex ATPase component TadA [Pantoea ananatis]
MKPAKEIADFVFAEQHPTQGVTLLIDKNRRQDPAIQRWAVDMAKQHAGAKTEFVTLSELSQRRESAVAQGLIVTENDLDKKDVSRSQDKVLSYFSLAYELHSSDIHFEISADRKLTIIRMRIHGELEVIDELTDEEGITLVSTVYISMCDVREQSFYMGREQSGRVDAKFARQAGLYGARYEHRATPDGLFVVMRMIPDDSKNMPTLAQLGFLPEQIGLVMQLLRLPSGMVLLTGPTGSGKSASMRSFCELWMKLTGGKKLLLTLENPTEGLMPGAIQTQVMPDDNSPEAISRAWNNGNASSLRLDPDALGTGEMRDLYSILAAIYACETGHLFFSTLHTKTPIGALRRMELFGIDRRLLADPSLIVGLIGQRLVPLLCESCKIPWSGKMPELDTETRERLEKYCNVEGVCTPQQLFFRNPEGCECCRKVIPFNGRVVSKGVTGRAAVAEVMRTDARMMKIWLSDGPDAARLDWIKRGGISRLMHLMRYLAEGRVDPLEADLICPLDEDEHLHSEASHVA